MRVAILLFEGVDLLDVGGPYEVFLTANRLAQRAGDESPFEVSTVSATDEPVRAYGGLRLGASTTLADAVGSEIVVVPGAVDIDAVVADPRVRSAVEALTADADITTSVCTGAFLLGDAGLLEGRPFTTHWEDVAALAERLGAPEGHARRAPWVDSGEVVTAGGLSCGISVALHLVGRLVGHDSALAVARQIDYAWQPA
jgi:transcriptional regulator GlxA family with amidase domain